MSENIEESLKKEEIDTINFAEFFVANQTRKLIENMTILSSNGEDIKHISQVNEKHMKDMYKAGFYKEQTTRNFNGNEQYLMPVKELNSGILPIFNVRNGRIFKTPVIELDTGLLVEKNEAVGTYFRVPYLKYFIRDHISGTELTRFVYRNPNWPNKFNRLLKKEAIYLPKFEHYDIDMETFNKLNMDLAFKMDFSECVYMVVKKYFTNPIFATDYVVEKALQFGSRQIIFDCKKNNLIITSDHSKAIWKTIAFQNFKLAQKIMGGARKQLKFKPMKVIFSELFLQDKDEFKERINMIFDKINICEESYNSPKFIKKFNRKFFSNVINPEIINLQEFTECFSYILSKMINKSFVDLIVAVFRKNMSVDFATKLKFILNISKGIKELKKVKLEKEFYTQIQNLEGENYMKEIVTLIIFLKK